MSKQLKKKVLVAMSGGVDSSVAAALLKKQGYFVVGGFMKNFSPESWKGVIDSNCPWEQDQKDAMAVCKKLGIDFRSFNFEKEYKEKIIQYFFDEYKAGRTPNPDIMCNKNIKFGLFLKKAQQLGFDFIATGHYARLRRKISNRKNQITKIELLKGKNPKKDQSYFLYQLNQQQLKKSLFPIGQYTKAQVRKMAHEFRLPNADKKDSQGLCFIGHINVREFLKQQIPEKPGNIVDEQGEIIGTHQGSWYYTLGQRHGLGIGGGTPYYVVEKNVKKNILVVGKGRGDIKNYGKKLIATKLHWLEKPKSFPQRCSAKIRYQQPDQKCVIIKKGNRHVVEFQKPQFAITPGQAVVFYKGNTVLGGGIIKKGLGDRVRV